MPAPFVGETGLGICFLPGGKHFAQTAAGTRVGNIDGIDLSRGVNAPAQVIRETGQSAPGE